MSGLESLHEALSEYQSEWRNSSLPPLEVSELFDLEKDFDKYYPFAEKPGCYVFFGEDYKISYVGKAVILGSRIGSYLRRDRENRRLKVLYEWKIQPRYIVSISVKEPFEAPSLEEFLILRLNPEDNTRGRQFAG